MSQISSLKQHPFICSQFYKSGVIDWVFCLVSPEVEIKVLAGLCSHLEFQAFFRAHMVVAEFSSLWSWDWGPCFLAGSQPKAALSFYGPHAFLVMWLPLSSKPAAENFLCITSRLYFESLPSFIPGLYTFDLLGSCD